jgi:hypothetical protein
MDGNRRQLGFSLIETLLAVGTLAIGMVFVAGTFTAGVYFASVATEKTVATVVTDEAVAKITLFGLNLNNAKLVTDGFVPYEDVSRIAMNDRESLYPSIDPNWEYAWSAICRRDRSDGRLAEFTIFVSRLMGVNATYWTCDDSNGPAVPSATSTEPSVPRPVCVEATVTGTTGVGGELNELRIEDDASTTGVDECLFLDAGFIIVDDATGYLYRVTELRERNTTAPTHFARVTISPAWQAAATQGSSVRVWGVPRPVTGGRCPIVTAYQKVMRF